MDILLTIYRTVIRLHSGAHSVALEESVFQILFLFRTIVGLSSLIVDLIEFILNIKIL